MILARYKKGSKKPRVVHLAPSRHLISKADAAAARKMVLENFSLNITSKYWDGDLVEVFSEGLLPIATRRALKYGDLWTLFYVVG